MKLRFWERFKGFFVSGGTAKKKFWPGEKRWGERCKYYDQIYENHPLAKAQILTIAGQLMAEGVFTEAIAEYPRAEEAKDKCDMLNEEIGLDVMLYETAARMAKYGSCFWEKTWNPEFGVRLHPYQELLEPAEMDPVEGVTVWRQTDGYKEVARYSSEEIIHFAWNITTKSWPYGTSLLVGLDTEFEILEQLETDLKEYMHKNAFPKELWRIGDKDYIPTDDEVTGIESKVKNWTPGESFVTSYPSEYTAGGTGDREVKGLDKILDFLKDQCIDGLMVPPISKQWSSTMASAKEMMPWARTNLISPMQRIIQRKVESEVYKPYLEDLGYSVKICPHLRFEPPDAHKEEDAEYWSKIVQSGICPPKFAAVELGIPEEEWDSWEAEKQAEQERMVQQKQKPQTEEDGEEEVYEVHRKQVTKKKPVPKPIVKETVSDEEFKFIKTQLATIQNSLYWQKKEDDVLRQNEKKILDYLSKRFGLE